MYHGVMLWWSFGYQAHTSVRLENYEYLSIGGNPKGMQPP